LPIAEHLHRSDPSNIEYRYALSRTYMELGEALHALHKNDDAIQYLTRAVDLQKSIASVSPDRIWNLRVFSRTYGILGSALLERGDPEGALKALQEGLATADRMLQRAPLSLYHRLDRADALEALGRHYLRMSAQSAVTQDRQAQLKKEARSWFSRSLAMWQDWTARNLAAPYAARRQSQAAAFVASCDQL
jgi:tetratricopeptide (TPR) repeat protein